MSYQGIWTSSGHTVDLQPNIDFFCPADFTPVRPARPCNVENGTPDVSSITTLAKQLWVSFKLTIGIAVNY